MKATGIVRRIDDLGRVVIPKELRRTMGIREGEPLEIYTSADGEVIFRKYSPVGALEPTARRVAEVLQRTAGLAVLVCDRDRAVAVAGLSRKEAVGKAITPAFDKVARERRLWVWAGGESLHPLEGSTLCAYAAAPVVAEGDIIGAMALIGEGNRTPEDTELKLLAAAAGFLGREAE